MGEEAWKGLVGCSARASAARTPCCNQGADRVSELRSCGPVRPARRPGTRSCRRTAATDAGMLASSPWATSSAAGLCPRAGPTTSAGTGASPADQGWTVRPRRSRARATGGAPGASRSPMAGWRKLRWNSALGWLSPSSFATRAEARSGATSRGSSCAPRTWEGGPGGCGETSPARRAVVPLPGSAASLGDRTGAAPAGAASRRRSASVAAMPCGPPSAGAERPGRRCDSADGRPGASRTAAAGVGGRGAAADRIGRLTVPSAGVSARIAAPRSSSCLAAVGGVAARSCRGSPAGASSRRRRAGAALPRGGRTALAGCSSTCSSTSLISRKASMGDERSTGRRRGPTAGGREVGGKAAARAPTGPEVRRNRPRRSASPPDSGALAADWKVRALCCCTSATSARASAQATAECATRPARGGPGSRCWAAATTPALWAWGGAAATTEPAPAAAKRAARRRVVPPRGSSTCRATTRARPLVLADERGSRRIACSAGAVRRAALGDSATKRAGRRVLLSWPLPSWRAFSWRVFSWGLFARWRQRHGAAAEVSSSSSSSSGSAKTIPGACSTPQRERRRDPQRRRNADQRRSRPRSASGSPAKRHQDASSGDSSSPRALRCNRPAPIWASSRRRIRRWKAPSVPRPRRPLPPSQLNQPEPSPGCCERAQGSSKPKRAKKAGDTPILGRSARRSHSRSTSCSPGKVRRTVIITSKLNGSTRLSSTYWTDNGAPGGAPRYYAIRIRHQPAKAAVFLDRRPTPRTLSRPSPPVDRQWPRRLNDR